VYAAGYLYQHIIFGSGRYADQRPAFNWVNKVLGNVKRAIRGTFHAASGKFVPHDLSEFTCRFNRRLYLPDRIERLLYGSHSTPPMPCRLLTLASPIQ
jgi:hypothetical protein